MPKLDGVSATSLIRQFDHMTPIISMTSNSKPNEIMTYYHSGACVVLFPHFLRAPGCVGVFRWAGGRARVVLLALGPAGRGGWG